MRPDEGIHVRRATTADALDISRLALEVQDVHVDGRPDLFKPGGGEPIADIVNRIGGPGQLYWVATLDGKAVGYAYARVTDEPESNWRYAARVVVLDQMGVALALRSHGIGEKLWHAVRNAAVAEGAERVVLNVWSFNNDARRFYERIGFTPFHERMCVELRDRQPESR